MSQTYPSDLPSMADFNRELAPFQNATTRRSLLQLVGTLIPYFALWGLMIYSLRFSYALTLALAVAAGGLLVRIFIFFHDCGHNSFFPSTRWNKNVGFWLGVLVFTPSEHWWHSHAIHHKTSGNLDKRGVGDVTMLTLTEYQQSSWLKKLGYRLFRHPLVMFGLGPFYMFILSHRVPYPVHGKKETRSVWLANLAILAVAVGMSLLIGWREYLMIQLPVILIGAMAGIWMFYVQHQFQGGYWARSGDWNYASSAMLGASFYKLPRLLDWFSGSIGYHHIHHLSPRIPNYNLRAAQQASPLVQKYERVITLGDSLKTPGLKLWDEANQCMVGFPRAGGKLPA